MKSMEMKLNEIIPMNNSFLEQWNRAIDGTIREKQRFNINYPMLENVLAASIKNQRFRRIGPIDKLIPVKKEEIISVALNFFQSIDEELYNEALKVILGQRDRTKMGIYNTHEVQNFNEKDENGMPKYTRDGNVTTYYGNSYVHIPLQERLHKKESKILGKEEGTLEDIYTLVHEIAHLFDLNKADTSTKVEEIVEPDRRINKRKVTRELLGEATTIAFEGLLTDYLLANHLYPESAIRDIANSRANSSLSDARIAYAKLVLAAEKEKNGEIKLEFVEKMMKENNMSVQDVRRTARRIIDDDKGALYRNRYAIGGLIAPTIIKAYEHDKQHGTQKLKAYLKAVYDDNFEGALHALGIEPNEQGIAILIKNMKARDAKINDDMER